MGVRSGSQACVTGGKQLLAQWCFPSVKGEAGANVLIEYKRMPRVSNSAKVQATAFRSSDLGFNAALDPKRVYIEFTVSDHSRRICILGSCCSHSRQSFGSGATSTVQV